jgi:hypothetical protein
MVNFSCGACGQRLQTDDYKVGQMVSCPTCQTGVEVPDRIEMPEGAEDASQTRDSENLIDSETSGQRKNGRLARIDKQTIFVVVFSAVFLLSAMIGHSFFVSALAAVGIGVSYYFRSISKWLKRHRVRETILEDFRARFAKDKLPTNNDKDASWPRKATAGRHRLDDEDEPADPGGILVALARVLIMLGIAIFIGGAAVTHYYWLVFDTTVLSDNAYSEGKHFHNVGLMNSREVGTIVGVGTALAGIGIILAGLLLGISEQLAKRRVIDPNVRAASVSPPGV